MFIRATNVKRTKLTRMQGVRQARSSVIERAHLSCVYAPAIEIVAHLVVFLLDKTFPELPGPKVCLEHIQVRTSRLGASSQANNITPDSSAETGGEAPNKILRSSAI